MKTLHSVHLFGIPITTSSKQDILEYIEEKLQKKEEKVFVSTPNPEIIMHTMDHPEFQHILSEARVALPDGIGLVLAARLLNFPIRQRVSGADFVFELCEMAASSSVKSKNRSITVGLLGGKGHVAEMAAKRLEQKIPGLKISYVSEEFDEQKFLKNTPDILFVAFGFPKQEEWISSHLSKYDTTLMMAVGGTFDYLSGRVSRAPAFIRAIGLEWSYRLIRQPWRWRRQLALIRFVKLTLSEKFHKTV